MLSKIICERYLSHFRDHSIMINETDDAMVAEVREITLTDYLRENCSFLSYVKLLGISIMPFPLYGGLVIIMTRYCRNPKSIP